MPKQPVFPETSRKPGAGEISTRIDRRHFCETRRVCRWIITSRRRRRRYRVGRQNPCSLIVPRSQKNKIKKRVPRRPSPSRFIVLFSSGHPCYREKYFFLRLRPSHYPSYPPWAAVNTGGGGSLCDHLSTIPRSPVHCGAIDYCQSEEGEDMSS